MEIRFYFKFDGHLIANKLLMHNKDCHIQKIERFPSILILIIVFKAWNASPYLHVQMLFLYVILLD